MHEFLVEFPGLGNSQEVTLLEHFQNISQENILQQTKKFPEMKGNICVTELIIIFETSRATHPTAKSSQWDASYRLRNTTLRYTVKLSSSLRTDYLSDSSGFPKKVSPKHVT